MEAKGGNDSDSSGSGGSGGSSSDSGSDSGSDSDKYVHGHMGTRPTHAKGHAKPYMHRRTCAATHAQTHLCKDVYCVCQRLVCPFYFTSSPPPLPPPPVIWESYLAGHTGGDTEGHTGGDTEGHTGGHNCIQLHTPCNEHVMNMCVVVAGRGPLPRGEGPRLLQPRARARPTARLTARLRARERGEANHASRLQLLRCGPSFEL